MNKFYQIGEIWSDINSPCKMSQDQASCPDSEIVKIIDYTKSYLENRVKQRKLFKY